MGLTLLNAYNVVVKDFSVVQPSFWANLAMQCENVYYHNMYVNATNLNPGPVSAPTSLQDYKLMPKAIEQGDPKTWLLNTDGANTWRSHNVTYGTPYHAFSLAASPDLVQRTSSL